MRGGRRILGNFAASGQTGDDPVVSQIEFSSTMFLLSSLPLSLFSDGGKVAEGRMGGSNRLDSSLGRPLIRPAGTFSP
jgi:hypothetical protein